jgi:uncharacterized membrane protein
MFKWIKSKISNIYNRWQNWKKRHPVVTATVGIAIVTNAGAIAFSQLMSATGMGIISPGALIFVGYCVGVMVISYIISKTDNMVRQLMINNHQPLLAVA